MAVTGLLDGGNNVKAVVMGEGGGGLEYIHVPSQLTGLTDQSMLSSPRAPS